MINTTSTDLPTIGDVILAWRKFRGLRSTELVKLAGIKHKGYLSSIEHNKRVNPKREYLEKLANVLRVPLRDIYGRRMPDEVKDGAFADGEDMQGFAPVEVAGAVGQPTQQALSPGTAFFAPLSSSNQEILMQRLETAEKRLEEAEKMLQAAAKNLQVAHEELLEFQALASEMFGEE